MRAIMASIKLKYPSALCLTGIKAPPLNMSSKIRNANGFVSIRIKLRRDRRRDAEETRKAAQVPNRVYLRYKISAQLYGDVSVSPTLAVSVSLCVCICICCCGRVCICELCFRARLPRWLPYDEAEKSGIWLCAIYIYMHTHTRTHPHTHTMTIIIIIIIIIIILIVSSVNTFIKLIAANSV